MKNESLFQKFTLDDITYKPAIFQNEDDEFPKLTLVDFYGVFTPEDNDIPYWFIIHSNPENYRFTGVFKAGGGPFDLQIPQHLEDLPQKETPVHPYRLVDDHYEIGTDAPHSHIKIELDKASIKLADVLDFTGEYFPFAILKHADDTMTVSQVTQTAILSGTYEGKTVKGIGNVELCYFPEEVNKNFVDYWSYIYAYDCGQREDGRKEFAMIRFALNGKSTGIYWLEGEEPVVSSDVIMEADWYKLPYETDNTCCYKDAVWKFAGKEIHFKGRWGHKGLTAFPRMGLKGQSQIMGDWYEGDTPYKHTVSMTFHENMDVYADKLAAAGFSVKED